MLIMDDPGHGGSDPGAIGPGGSREKDINLNVALEFASIMGEAATVKLTRDSDIGSEPWERAELANQAGAAVFISFHCNSPKARGTEIWTSRGDTEADRLANIIGRRWMEAFPEMPFRSDYSDGDIDKEKNFDVLWLTNMPAVIIELDFIAHPDGEKNLLNPVFQKKAARVIAEGVAEFLGLELPVAVPEDPNRVTIEVGDLQVPGTLIDGVTNGPIRQIFEYIGYPVTWDEKTRTVKISLDGA
jgi:N-acetylmuramoyl-L-alanine amidase